MEISIKTISPFYKLFTIEFCTKFQKRETFFSNFTTKSQTIKADTALGSNSFELVRNMSQCNNTVTHLHEDIDGSMAMCSMKTTEFPIHHLMENDHVIAHSAPAKIYTVTPHNHLTIQLVLKVFKCPKVLISIPSVQVINIVFNLMINMKI